MTKPRVKRVANELKQEVSRIIDNDLKDPRIGFVTITDVEMTPDLRLAKVYFSILGTDKNKRDTSIGLQKAKGYIRRLIGQRLKLRYTPQIEFLFDKSSEYAQHIQEIIEKIHKKEDRKE